MENRSPRNEEKSYNVRMEEVLLIVVTVISIIMSVINLTKLNNITEATEMEEISEVSKVVVKTEDIVEAEVFKTELKSEEVTPKEVEISEEEEEDISYKEIDEIIEEISPDMDISEPSGISKNDFVTAMQQCEYDKNSVLADNAILIWENCNERQLNEFAIVGIIAIESGWADPEVSELTAEKNNIMSIRNDEGEYKTYYSYSECIEDAIRILDENYLEENGRYATGGNLQDISAVYAEDTNWANGVAECAEMSTRGLKQTETETISKE